MERYPQVMINIKASDLEKAKYEVDEEIKKAIEEVSQRLGTEGRILVRASGTEPLIRDMVEGKDFDIINEYAVEVGNVIKERIS